MGWRIRRFEAIWRGDFMSRVLVVDDEDYILDVTKRMLATCGVSVITAAGGEEALEVFRERADEIDCVLLDLNMPGLGGEEAFVELRRIRPEVPIVLCSGRYPHDVIRRLGDRSVASVATKPYRMNELMAHITQALEWKP